MRFRSIEGQPGTLQIYVTSQVYFAHRFPNLKSVYIVNIFDNLQVQPKRCRKILIPIYALSLHVRQHEDDDTAQSSGPFNELKLNGNFTIAEVRFFYSVALIARKQIFFHILLRFFFQMHAWLSLILPDVPERPHIHEGEAALVYISSFIGTVLKCKYK